MSRFKVLITDYAWPDVDIERAILREVDAELIVAEDRTPEGLARQAADVDAIMTNWVRVPATVLEAAPKCRIVARLGIGLDNIDVAAASRLGMLVTNVPDYCLEEVAEHSLALMLALGRKVAYYHHATKSGTYQLQSGPLLQRIQGQTLGIVGLGNIGSRLAERCAAIGLKILVTGRERRQLPDGWNWVDLDTLLAKSDYISLHLPLTEKTRHMIGSAQFARMKPTAYLINTARGGLIDSTALAKALDAGQLAGAGLDVQDPEPPPLDKPPYNNPRVIVTPHAAFVSAESLENLRTRTARQVAACLSGKEPENIRNSAALARG